MEGMNIRRGIPVLEEVKVGAARVLHLEGNSLASGTSEGGDSVRVARRDGDIAEVLGHGGEVAEAGGLIDSGRELSEVDRSITAEAEG
jgi:hypothetical protein